MKMVIYRTQRGALIDSMNETIGFENETELKNYIQNKYSKLIEIENVVINDNYYNDERTGWEDTRYVCIVTNGEKQCGVMCATKYGVKTNEET